MLSNLTLLLLHSSSFISSYNFSDSKQSLSSVSLFLMCGAHEFICEVLFGLLPLSVPHQALVISNEPNFIMHIDSLTCRFIELQMEMLLQFYCQLPTWEKATMGILQAVINRW